MAILKLQLIGGAPLTGKTTLASSIAGSQHATVLATDNIRTWMQSVCSSSDFPHLFSSHNLSAEQYYQKFPTAQAALQEEIDQGRDVGVGVIELLSIQNLPWDYVVLEGIAVTPELVSALDEKLPEIDCEATFLYDNNHDRIKRRVYNRGLWAESNSYSDEVKPIEVEWTGLYNEWYREQTKKFGFEITPVKENRG
jgi:2-phosphoglycerate kinase